MKLLVDIGNTRSKFALEDSDGVQPAFTVVHEELTQAVLASHCSPTLKPTSAWLSCVGPADVLETVNSWVIKQFKFAPAHITVTEECCGIVNAYHDIPSLGVDRWVAAIGARSLATDGDLIVIDAGTAITIDWISSNDVFEGGVIIPGYDLMHRSLVGNTIGIKSEAQPADRIIGKTTSECVNSGLSYGLIGAVEHIVREMQQHIPQSSHVLVTGGGADFLASRLAIRHLLEPRLVLLGLAAIAESTQ